MLSHLRLAFRQLAKTPGFTTTALATLALCLGANLVIYAVVNAILLRPLPFPESERLVSIVNAYPAAGAERSSASIPNYFERRGAINALSSISLIQEHSVIIGEAGAPNRAEIGRVTPEFFATLGVSFASGQTFTDAELTYGADQVAVLTDGFWRTHFNADPEVVGQTFLNDGLPITVIGVLPRDFRFLSSRAQFFRPFSHESEDRDARNRHNNNAQMIGRLAPGATLTEAQAQLDALNESLLPSDPYVARIRESGFRTNFFPLHADHVREIRPTLVLLQCGALFLLLIGAVNLANLLLIRASSRTKEVAVRQALGARGFHLAREVLTETLLLALAGGALGLLLGAFGVQLLAKLGTDQLPLGATIAMEARTAATIAAATVLVGVLLALPAIWFNQRIRLASGLQADSRGGTASRAAQRVRHGFIVAQVAMAFVLLSSASLLGLSLKRALETPTGFNADNLLTGRIALPWKNYQTDDARLAFVERLLPAIRSLPGVTYAAISYDPPFTDGGADGVIQVEGYEPRPGETTHAHYLSSVTAEYWSALGIPLLRGRFLEDADNHRPQRVCVVDQDFAKYYWGDGDPIGRRIASGLQLNEERLTTIVGVVASVKQNTVEEPAGHGAVYFPYELFNSIVFSLVVRTVLPPVSLAPSIEKAILQLDPGLPLDDVQTMQSRIDQSLVGRRSPAILAGIFAGSALLLAAIGTYGVLAYAVSQRRREIGVRMALGAMPGQILAQFLHLGAKLLAIGVALGVGGAWIAGRFMHNQVFGVGAFHGGVLAATGGLMLIVVLFATLLPARRAAKVDPLVALRAD